MATVYSATFTAANGTLLSAYTPEIGDALVRQLQVGGGDAIISSNRATANGSGGVGAAYRLASAMGAYQRVRGKMVPSGAQPYGPYVCGQSGEVGYFIEFFINGYYIGVGSASATVAGPVLGTYAGEHNFEIEGDRSTNTVRFKLQKISTGLWVQTDGTYGASEVWTMSYTNASVGNAAFNYPGLYILDNSAGVGFDDVVIDDGVAEIIPSSTGAVMQAFGFGFGF